MTIDELVKVLQDMREAHGNMRVEMMIETKEGQYMAPILDTAYAHSPKDQRCILIFEEPE